MVTYAVEAFVQGGFSELMLVTGGTPPQMVLDVAKESW
jgi:hypothetical protein